MSMRLIFVLIGLFFSAQVMAFNCYLTLVKDSCWTNYNVTVDVIDAGENKTILTIEVPAGKSWNRQQFTCEPSQRLMYKAKFTPVFWQSEKGKSYMAIRYWVLPSSIKATDVAWNVSVCYPSDFSGVPFPPDAEGNCKCDFKSLPSIKASDAD
ncbi:hypothetical protein FOG18_10780 [Legionella israelensis]|uniref:hypothetical protein n=1 Tax=Legionella israelensis TaxID=454 RepID=UPI0011812B7D|nr:hypothetical protein [Legionella israelensis]QDP73014.1 hypothetical protein FOG18_10780 [Legionella israelensis]